MLPLLEPLWYLINEPPPRLVNEIGKISSKIRAKMIWEKLLKRLGLTARYHLQVDDPSPQQPAVKSLEKHPNRSRQICRTLPTLGLQIWATYFTPSPSPS